MSKNLEIMMYCVWVFVMIMAIIIEFSTCIYIGWAAFAAGAAALLTHTISKKLTIQIIVFMVMWILLWAIMFLFGKYIFKKKLHDKNDGYMSYIGQEYEVKYVNKIGFGYISINDKVFRFTSSEKTEKGDIVRIKKIVGVTFKAEKVIKKNQQQEREAN